MPNTILNSLDRVVRTAGGISVPELYLASDPGSSYEAVKRGYISFPFGSFFGKGLKIGTGLCSVKRYNRYLKDFILSGKARPSFVVSHEISMDEVPDAYEKYNKRIYGYAKVLIHPGS